MLMNQVLFQAAVALVGSLACISGALLYFQRVRLERPAIGTFNGRDMVMIAFFIIVLPILYLILPSIFLTGFLLLTFTSALYITFSPIVPLRLLWLGIIAILGMNIVVTMTMLGTKSGWQLYWIVTSMVVLFAAVGVSNLYIQGGMRMQHIAWFALFLAVYDGFFSLVIPLTPKLADAFEGRPLDPSIGFTIGSYNANIGLGDLLIYCLFTVAAYKGFGRRGALAACVIVTIFGALVPAMVPLVVTRFVRQGVGIVVPAQTFFGPVAFATYWWLQRSAPERTMRQWFETQDTFGHAVVRVRRPVRVRAAVAQ